MDVVLEGDVGWFPGSKAFTAHQNPLLRPAGRDLLEQHNLPRLPNPNITTNRKHNIKKQKVGLEKRELVGFSKFFLLYYGQKNNFTDLHVSGYSNKTFLPL